MVSQGISREEYERALERVRARQAQTRPQPTTPAGLSFGPTVPQTSPGIPSQILSGLAGLGRAVVPQGVRDVAGAGLRGAGSAIAEFDRPLSERIGLEVPQMRGPLDDIANIILQEATRPTNALIALGGVPAAARLAATGTRAGRVASRIVAPVAEGAGMPARVAGEAVLSAGARGGAEALNQVLPEDTNPILRTTASLAAGLVGGVSAVGAMARIKPQMFVRPNIQVGDDGAFVLRPPEGAEQFFQPIKVSLSDKDELFNALRATVGKPFGMTQESAIVKPAMLERHRANMMFESEGTRVANTARSNYFRAFGDESPLQIRSLANEQFPDGPTLADVLARIDDFAPRLTEQQQAYAEGMREQLSQFRTLEQSVGIDTGIRGDLTENGIYIPRGRATEEGADVPIRGRGGKSAHERHAIFQSQAEGIKAGYEYADPFEAIEAYIRDVGRRSTDMYIGSYFKEVVDPLTGQKVFQTAADRIPEGLRNQVNSIRAKLSGKRTTLARQNARMAEQLRQQRRAQGLVTAADERAARAAGRLDNIAFTADDLTAVRAEVADLFNDARAIRDTIGENRARLRNANVEMNAQERALLQRMDELDRLITDVADVEIHNISRVPPQIDSINRQIDGMTDDLIKMSERVDDLIARGQVYRDMDAGVRSEFVRARQVERTLQNQQRMMDVAARELRQLEREQARMTRLLQQQGTSASQTESRIRSSMDEIAALRNQLDSISGEWNVAKDIAAQIPRGQGAVNITSLRGYSAPDDIATAVNRSIEREMKATGKMSEMVNTISAFNNLYRGMRATLDMSGPGIQGVLGLANDPAGYGNAFKFTWRAWADSGDRILGDYITDFDKVMRQQGKATTDVWTRNDLRLGGRLTEFTSGPGFEKIPSRILNTTPWKQANKAFGYFGDALRLQWADSMLDGELARGRTLQQIIDSGDLRRIANSANSMTGWSANRFGGTWGDMLLFAPRFLQARLETVGRALAGLGPNPNLEQKLALKSMMQMISVGAGLSAFIHYAFNDGEMIDVRPLKEDGNWNPNFMRIRAGGRDWSFFGTWDSLLRAMVLTGEGKPHEAMRGMGSGTVANAWNAISGSTAIGDPRFRDLDSTVTGIAETFIPFAMGDIAENLQKAAQGDIAGITGIPGDIMGMKSAPLTPSEERDIVSRREFGKDWQDLTGQERQQIEQNNPEIFSRIDERIATRASTGDPRALLQVRRREIDRERVDGELNALSKFAQGDLSRSDLADSLSHIAMESAIRKDEVSRFTQQEFEPNSEQAMALSEWFNTFEEAEIAPGRVDWELRDALEADLMRRIDAGEFGDPTTAKRAIEERRAAEHPPELQWFFDARQRVSDSDYYRVQDDSFVRFRSQAQRLDPSINSMGDLMRAINRAEREGNLRMQTLLNSVKRRIDSETQRRRTTLRRRNAQLDADLFTIGRVSTVQTAQARKLLQ